MAKIMAAMSGGVDSSVAALLLKQQGHDVVGVTMCLGVAVNAGQPRACCGPEAIGDARAVCDTLGIPHYVFDFSDDMAEHVVNPFLSEYARGRTPNPCIACNRFLKFGSLLRRARAMGFNGLATGHYARIVQRDNGWCLERPVDSSKDQTYFLYSIPRESLPFIQFPLWDLHKRQVRELATQAGLPVATKAESQDICFVPDGDYRALLPAGAALAGPFVDPSGKVLGTHKGITHYTVGQRKGLGIAAGYPLYVIEIRTDTNTVVLGERAALLSGGLMAQELNLLADRLPAQASVVIRYTHAGVAANLTICGDSVRIEFTQPQEAVTPGQAAVFYEGDRVAGGAIIARPLPSTHR